MTHTAELLPCPFCGGESVTAYHHQIEGWEESWHVECNADNCGNGTCHHETEAEAITAWNTRAGIPYPAQLRADRDVLEALEGLRDFVGCPVCGGDCSSANPPVNWCPMEKVNTLISRIRGEGE